MVQYYRYHQPGKGEEDDRENWPTLILDWRTTGYYKRFKRKLLPMLLLFTLVSCSLIFVPQFLSYSETLSFNYSFQVGNDGPITDEKVEAFPSSTTDGALVCDRRAFRYDTCSMRGDIRTLGASSSIINYLPDKDHYDLPPLFEEDVGLEEEELQHETIKPYTRKWERSIMDTIHDLELVVKKDHLTHYHECDVRHSVPAVVFSAGGYTGNVYHEFNDGIIPLYITSQQFKKKVVFVVTEYRSWWYTKYGVILSHLSDYPPIDLSGDPRTHCFPEAIVGLKIHDDLTVNSSFMPGNESIRDFRKFLDKVYRPRIRGLIQKEEKEAQLRLENRLAFSPLPLEEVVRGPKKSKPIIVIISRKGSRAISNEAAMVKLAKEIGFQVEILRPDPTTELAKIYRVLNSSDAIIGVHGAALTHLLFMRPGTIFIQIIPLGTEWAAHNYYGEPALKLGLNYVGYKILPMESSLYKLFDKNDPVLTDPASVNAKGWHFTKKIYLDGQNIKLNLRRFRKRLDRAYEYTIAKRTRKHQQKPQ